MQGKKCATIRSASPLRSGLKAPVAATLLKLDLISVYMGDQLYIVLHSIMEKGCHIFGKGEDMPLFKEGIWTHYVTSKHVCEQ